jgi:NAD(P) transhydrogenase
VIDSRDELIAFPDQEISDALADAMNKKLGIEFIWKNHVMVCQANDIGDSTLEFDTGKWRCVNAVLVAAGRASNTATLTAAAAGIALGPKGRLTVDSHYRTSVPHIYAAGDVIDFPALASTSMEQARVAMCHAFEQRYKTALALLLPTGIYAIPEVSMIGPTEEQLKSEGIDYVVERALYGQCARGEIIRCNCKGCTNDVNIVL